MLLLQGDSNKAEPEPVGLCCTNTFPLTNPFSGKYLRKLIGKTDTEDALKRLDRLIQQDARMADVQLLKVMNMIRVREVADNVLAVGNCTRFANETSI